MLISTLPIPATHVVKVTRDWAVLETAVPYPLDRNSPMLARWRWAVILDPDADWRVLHVAAALRTAAQLAMLSGTPAEDTLPLHRVFALNESCGVLTAWVSDDHVCAPRSLSKPGESRFKALPVSEFIARVDESEARRDAVAKEALRTAALIGANDSWNVVIERPVSKWGRLNHAIVQDHTLSMIPERYQLGLHR